MVEQGKRGVDDDDAEKKKTGNTGKQSPLVGTVCELFIPLLPFFFPSANPPHHARCQKDLVKNRKKKNRLVYRKTKQKVITAKPPFYFCEKPIDMARQAEKKTDVSSKLSVK